MSTQQSSAINNKKIRSIIVEVLEVILSKNIESIEPQYSEDIGFFYPDVLPIASKYNVSEERLLQELTRAGVLKEEPFKHLIRCPSCQSVKLISYFKCPNCDSPEIYRRTVFTHIPCGYIGTLEDAEEKDGIRICPKCNNPIKKDEYEVIGMMFHCKNCSFQTEAPHPAYECQQCNRKFDHKDANYHQYFRYIVNKEKVKDLLLDNFRTLMLEALQKRGIRAEANTHIVGKSGLSHPTDILATGRNNQLTIDMVIDKNDIFKILGKNVDTDMYNHIALVRQGIDITPSIEENPRTTIVTFKNIVQSIEETAKKVQEKLTEQQGNNRRYYPSQSQS